jgi:hypothetical protein
MKARSPASAGQLNFEPFQKEPASGPKGAKSPDGAPTEPWSGEEELILLAEQLQSDKLPPLEAARGYQRLTQPPYGLSPAQIARALAQEPRVVQQALSLLTLPEELQKMLEARQLSVAQLEFLQRLRRHDDMTQLARQASIQKWDAVTTERHVDLFLGEIEKTEQAKTQSHLAKLLGDGASAHAEDIDPLTPLWARLREHPVFQTVGDWHVQYRGALRWSFDIKPKTTDAAASRVRLAEWFRRMAELFEGRER